MSQSDANKSNPAGAGGSAVQDAPCILTIGISPALLDRIRKTTDASFAHAEFAELDVQLIAQVMPDIVLAPLFGRGFDAVDLADRLTEMGYRGALHAVTAPLPDPEAVRREVKHHCGDIVFSLIELKDPATN